MWLFNAFWAGLIQAGTKNLGVPINEFCWPGDFFACVASLLLMVNLQAAMTQSHTLQTLNPWP